MIIIQQSDDEEENENLVRSVNRTHSKEGMRAWMKNMKCVSR
jgi:hypothetical protein